MDFDKLIQGMKEKEKAEEQKQETKPAISAKAQKEKKLNGVRERFPKFIEDLKSIHREEGDRRFDEDAISDNIYYMDKGLEDDEIDLLTKELSKALEKEGFENETKHRMRFK